MRKLIAAFLVLTVTSSVAMAEGLFRPILGHSMPFDSTGRAVTDSSGFLGGYNIGAFTEIIRLVCTQSCFVAFSATDVTPSISTTSATAMFLPANVPEFFSTRGRARIAVIRLSSDGTLYINEMSK